MIDNLLRDKLFFLLYKFNSQARLARRLKVHPSTVSRVIKALIPSDFIENPKQTIKEELRTKIFNLADSYLSKGKRKPTYVLIEVDFYRGKSLKAKITDRKTWRTATFYNDDFETASDEMFQLYKKIQQYADSNEYTRWKIVGRETHEIDEEKLGRDIEDAENKAVRGVRHRNRKLEPLSRRGRVRRVKPIRRANSDGSLKHHGKSAGTSGRVLRARRGKVRHQVHSSGSKKTVQVHLSRDKRVTRQSGRVLQTKVTKRARGKKK